MGGKLTYVNRQCGAIALAFLYSECRKRSMRRRPCQRTMLGGISLPSANMSTGRMVREGAHLIEQLILDTTGLRPVVEKRDVLHPRQPDHDPQTVPLGRIQQIATGGVDPHRVDAVRRHQTEVFVYPFERRKLIAVGVRREGAVRRALDEVTLSPKTQELPVDFDATIVGGGAVSRTAGSGWRAVLTGVRGACVLSSNLYSIAVQTARDCTPRADPAALGQVSAAGPYLKRPWRLLLVDTQRAGVDRHADD